MKDYKEHLDLEKLGLSIQMLAKPSMGLSVRAKIKTHLMGKIRFIEQTEWPESLNAVVKYIRKLVSGLNFGAQERAKVKERIFSTIEATPQKMYVFTRFFDFSKRFVGATLLVTMFFGMIAFVNVNMNVVRAEAFTTLDSFSGEVSLERDGKVQGIYVGMEIKENDKIITGSNGAAVISYFDDSITRLSKGTELVVDKLFNPRNNYVDSYVEVSLLDGTVWSKVINLVGEDSSFVVKADDVYTSSKKAAFNVEKTGGRVEVKVFNNTVNVVNENTVDKVVSGQKAVVSDDDVQIAKILDSEKESDWVQENINSDKEYLIAVEKKLVTAKMKSIGADTDDDLSLENSLKENTILFLTFGDVEKQKVSLDLAEKKFVAAEVKLHGQTLEEADQKEVQAAIDEFSKQVTNYYSLIKEVGYTDKDYAAELKSYADDKLLVLKKDLSPVLPDSPLYALKDQVDKLLVSGATDEKQIAEIKLDQVMSKLSDAEEVADTGSGQLVAEGLISESKQNIDEAVKMIESIDNTKIEDKKELVDRASDYFDLLNAVENTTVVDDKEMAVLKQKVDDLKQEVASAQTGSGAVVTPETSSGSVISTPVVPIVAPVTEEPEEQPYGVNVEGDKPLPPGL